MKYEFICNSYCTNKGSVMSEKSNLGNWLVLSDLKFWNNEAAQLYAVRAIPQNFLIGPDGKIVGKNLRGEDLENKLKELFSN